MITGYLLFPEKTTSFWCSTKSEWIFWERIFFEQIARVEVSLISYKDQIWFHTVHAWFFSTILVWNQKNHIWSLYDYQEIIYDPSTNTKNHSSISWKSPTIFVFLFLFGRVSPVWDPGITLWSAKRPYRTISIASWAQNKRVSPNR